MTTRDESTWLLEALHRASPLRRRTRPGLFLLVCLLVQGIGCFPGLSMELRASPAILAVTDTPPDKEPTPDGGKSRKNFVPADIVEDLAKRGDVIPPTPDNPIDLSTALRLAEVENPVIGISRQAIQQALAKQLQANFVALPHLRAGANYRNHQGVLQTSFGEIRHVNLQSVYFGGGAKALAAETVAPFPMVQFFNHLGDPWFEPLAAGQFVAVTEFQASAVSNVVLLEVARRFFDLMSAEGELAALRRSEAQMNLIVQTTAAFAQARKGRDADARRSRTEALLLHNERIGAEEHVAVAAAELARVLRLDPAVRLRTPGQTIVPFQIVDPGYSLEQLIQLALNGRPELAAIQAEIDRRQTRYRQERVRPFLPTVSIAYSAGGFGGGTNRTDLVHVHPQFGRVGSRADFDVVAYWTVLNGGVGNLAIQNERRAQRELARIEQVRLVNQVRREVAAALALSIAQGSQFEIARERLRAAEKGFQEDYDRVRGGIGLPIEVLNSMNRLVQARLALIQNLAAYNQAQFQLFVSLGQTPLAAVPPLP